ncbi:MAG: NHL repeat-containing protein, partial [Acidimicrobiales bacterium]
SGTISVLPATTTTLFGVSVTANNPTPVVSSGLREPSGLAFDSAGDLYVADPPRDAVLVLPKTTTTLFGVSVTADTLSSVVDSQLGSPVAAAVDSSWDLFIDSVLGVGVSGGLGVSDPGGIVAFPQHSGTIFGVPVTADHPTTIVTGSALSEAIDIAFDSAGNLYISNEGSGTISVLAKSTTTLFGVPVFANTLTTLEKGLTDPAGLAFDAAGNIYVVEGGVSGTISVLPATTTTLFGVSVTANVPTTVASLLGDPLGLAFDAAGDLYFGQALFGTISVLPATTTTLFGVPVTANAVTTVATTTSEPVGLAFDAAGNLYLSSVSISPTGFSGSVSVLAKANGSIFGVPVTADILTAVAGSGLTAPGFMAFDSSGDLFIPDSLSSTVFVLAPPSS